MNSIGNLLRCFALFTLIVNVISCSKNKQYKAFSLKLPDSDRMPVVVLPIEKRPSLSESNYKKNFEPELIAFKDESTKLFGYRDRAGVIKIPAQFPMALTFGAFGLADVLHSDGNWYKINSEGLFLFQTYLFDNGPDYYVNGYARMIKRGKVGFYVPGGRIVIPPSFDYAGIFAFNAPIVLACIGCKEECIDTQCEHPITRGGKWGAVNKQGKIVVPFEFDDHIDRAFDEAGSGRVPTLTFYKNKKPYPLYIKSDQSFELIGWTKDQNNVLGLPAKTY